jgi:hypothetical protein
MPENLKTKTTVVATVFDATAPMRPLAALGIALCTVGLLLPLPLLQVGFCTLFAWDLRPRRRPRATTIDCRGGWIRVAGLGVVHARDVLGATTARHEGRFTLLVAHKRRKHTPIIIDVADESALACITKSLGIGHHGFGEVGAVMRRAAADRFGWLTSFLAIPLFICSMVVSDPASQDLVRSMLTLVLMACVFGVVVRLAARRPRVLLTGGGVFLPQASAGIPVVAGGTFIPFGAIERVESAPDELRIHVAREYGPGPIRFAISPARWLRQAVSNGELAHILSQIRAASERAHGNYTLKHEAGTLTDLLRRQPSENLREWLARIDTLGVGATGYRATELDQTELWSILEDPEADGDVRAASARVLTRIAPAAARLRVKDVLETVREPAVRTRIAASIDDDALAEEEEIERAAAQARAHS